MRTIAARNQVTRPSGHGAEVAERPAAAVVRVLRVLDVGDDRVELARREICLLENRGITYGPDAHRLGDLHAASRPRAAAGSRAGDVPALGDDLVAARAVLGEHLLAAAEVSRAPGAASGSAGRSRARRRTRSSARSAAAQEDAASGAAESPICGERHVAGAEVEVRGRAPTPRSEARAPFCSSWSRPRAAPICAPAAGRLRRSGRGRRRSSWP